MLSIRGPGLVGWVILAAAVQFVFLHGYLLHGGLSLDDWPLAAKRHFSGTGSLISGLLSGVHERPVQDVYLGLTTSLSGTSTQLHALWGFITHLLCELLVALTCRSLGMPRVAAAALVLLVMLFPFSDSIWLWYAASGASLAIAFAAAGVLFVCRGTERGRGWPWHLAAMAMFAASVLTYQVAAAAVIMTLPIYLRRLRPLPALGLWMKDVLAVAAASVLPSLITGSAGTYATPALPLTASALSTHARLMLNQGASLLARVLVPFGAAKFGVVAPVVVAVAAGGVWQAIRGGSLADRRWARSWLGWGAAGILLIFAAYADFVPASLFYVPLSPGQGDRVNALAGIGYCLLALSLAMLLAALLVGVGRTSLRAAGSRHLFGWSTALACVLLAILGVGWFARVRRDIHAWNSIATVERAQLAELRSLGRPTPGTVDYVGGRVGETAPGVFAFGWPADLEAAVQLAWNDETIRTWPILNEDPLRCTARGVFSPGTQFAYSSQQDGAFPNVLFTNLRTGTRLRVKNEAECRRAVATTPAFPPQS